MTLIFKLSPLQIREMEIDRDMQRLNEYSTEAMPGEKPKPSEKTGLPLNEVRKSPLLCITVSHVFLNERMALIYLQSDRFLLKH